ncbi:MULTISPECIES: glycosyltransferase family 2 protein [Chitinophagaceae]|uniref:glycosyltransferase family 2 protein n=1 Tax=Chitinophagaceae TaxID=563835 RepID=UPI000DEEAFB2|nr:MULTISPECIES: glycosyltransferase family 2 protein [Chitinophagaceae]RPD50818.1 glycosyltransferase [Paracnuella aquatica]
MKQPCSLIIATYNWPQALELCLESVQLQTVLPQEIIIADDGSGDETRLLIEQFAVKSKVPIVHVWHPDEGFQLAKIRNRAMARAAFPYIIQIDGDLILHPHFIEDHLHLQEPHFFVSGSRVLLSARTTAALLQHRSLNVDKHHQGSKNFFNKLRNRALRNLLSRHYKTEGKNKYYVKGCNMAFWRDDLLLVNGYNEAFTGWGREDSELAIRLINAGVKKKFLKMGGVTYHLYHREASRDNEAENIRMMDEAIQQKTKWGPVGISQYLNF